MKKLIVGLLIIGTLAWAGNSVINGLQNAMEARNAKIAAIFNN